MFLELRVLHFEDLSIGMTERLSKTISSSDVVGFAEVTGDRNPIHLSEHFAARTPFGTRIAHGLYTASLISAVLGTRLPGPGAVYISQTLNFRAPVRIGDTVEVEVAVAELIPDRRRARLVCTCRVGDEVVLDGEAWVKVPVERAFAREAREPESGYLSAPRAAKRRRDGSAGARGGDQDQGARERRGGAGVGAPGGRAASGRQPSPSREAVSRHHPGAARQLRRDASPRGPAAPARQAGGRGAALRAGDQPQGRRSGDAQQPWRRADRAEAPRGCTAGRSTGRLSLPPISPAHIRTAGLRSSSFGASRRRSRATGARSISTR